MQSEEIEQQPLSPREQSPDLLDMGLQELFDPAQVSPDLSLPESPVQYIDAELWEAQTLDDDIELEGLSSREQSPDDFGDSLRRLFDTSPPPPQLVTPPPIFTPPPMFTPPPLMVSPPPPPLMVTPPPQIVTPPPQIVIPESDTSDQSPTESPVQFVDSSPSCDDDDANDQICELLDHIREDARELRASLQQQQIDLSEDDTSNSSDQQASSPTEDLRFLFEEHDDDTSTPNRSPSPQVCEGFEDFFKETAANHATPDDLDSAISEDNDDQDDSNKSSTGIFKSFDWLYGRRSSQSRSSSSNTHPMNDNSSTGSSHSPEPPRRRMRCRHGSQEQQEEESSPSPSPPPPDSPVDKSQEPDPRGCTCQNNLHYHSPLPTDPDGPEFSGGVANGYVVGGNNEFIDYEVIEISVPPRIGFEDPNLKTAANGRLDDSSDEEFETPIIPIHRSPIHRVSVAIHPMSPPLEQAPRFGNFLHTGPLPNRERTPNRQSPLDEHYIYMHGARERTGLCDNHTPSGPGPSRVSRQEPPPTRQQPQHSHTGREQSQHSHGETPQSRERSHDLHQRTNSGRERSENPRLVTPGARHQSRREEPSTSRARDRSWSPYAHLPPIRESSPPVRDRSPFSRREPTPTDDVENLEREIVDNLQQVTITPETSSQNTEMSGGPSHEPLESSTPGTSAQVNEMSGESSHEPLEASASDGSEQNLTNEEQSDQTIGVSRKRARHSKKETGADHTRSQKMPKHEASPRKRSQKASQARSAELPPRRLSDLERRYIELFGSPSPPPRVPRRHTPRPARSRRETPAPLEADRDDVELEMIEGRMRSPLGGFGGESGRPRPASPLPLRELVEPVRPQPLRAAEPCCLLPPSTALPDNDDQVLPSLSGDED